MEIISRSNHGFRKRPTFQKIANKPNKNIDWVVNPLKIVRDSYEFSNLINDDNFVEDEIKNQITNEMFHEEVQKEIGRRQTMEQDRRNRTAEDLRGPRLPTNLPEQAAQQRVAPQIYNIGTPQTFDTGASDDLMYYSPMSHLSRTQAAPILPSPQAAPPEEPSDMNVDSRVRLRARRSIPQAAPQAAPSPKAAPPEGLPATVAQTIEMDIEPVSTKRPTESREERIRKAAKGTEVISDLRDTMKNKSLTNAMIQQQLIMHNIPFDANARRQELAMIVDNPEHKRKLEAEVNDQTIKKRLKNYLDEHGQLPIAIYIKEAGERASKKAKPKSSSSNEPQPQATTGASSSNDPQPPPTDVNDSSSSSDEEKNIEFKNSAPLVMPSKIGIQAVREKLIEAYNQKKIVDSNDLKIYHTNIDMVSYKKSSARDFILKNLRGLYKRLVYNPINEERKREKSKSVEGSPRHVKKTINKYKVLKEEKRNSGSKR